MAAGTYKHAVQLQQETRTQTDTGGGAYVWETVDALVWVNITPVVGMRGGSSALVAQQLENATLCKLEMRYRTDVHIGMRFVEETPMGTVAYVLRQEPVDPKETYFFLEAMCQRAVLT